MQIVKFEVLRVSQGSCRIAGDVDGKINVLNWLLYQVALGQVIDLFVALSNMLIGCNKYTLLQAYVFVLNGLFVCIHQIAEG